MQYIRVIFAGGSLNFQNEVNSWIATYSPNYEIISIEYKEPFVDIKYSEAYFTAIITYKKEKT